MTMRNPRLTYYTGGVLVYTLLVILWGAFVRATGSGAGCGNHWPLCNGEIIPRPELIETLIEFTHRLMTGLLLPLVFFMVYWIYRTFGQGHPARTGAGGSLLFLLIESLIGAGLVRFDLVADNASIARAVSGALHLVNTFLLLAWLSLTVWWTAGGPQLRVDNPNITVYALGLSLFGMILLGASGAVTALGDTLFPSESILSGFRQDLSPTAHFLIRLRIFHPLIAIAVSFFTVSVTALTSAFTEHEQIKRINRFLIVFILAQLMLGLLNVILLAPIWLQLIHLLVSDIIWITLIIFSATYLQSQYATTEPVPQPQSIKAV